MWNGAQTNVTKIDALTIGTKEIEAVRQRHQRLATSMEQKLDVGELGQGKETSSASVLKARGWEGMVLWPGKTMPNDGRVGEGRKKKRPDNERKSLGTSNIERVYGFRTVGIHNSVRWVQDDADDVMGTWNPSVRCMLVVLVGGTCGVTSSALLLKTRATVLQCSEPSFFLEM